MKITSAEFITSSVDVINCPTSQNPEFAFIGRSNVGKSSLINMIVNSRKLAKTSVTPGKTQTINHFLINDAWYLVDLPGYGFATVSKSTREGFGKMIEEYILKRPNLYCLFILIDSRHEPQAIDLKFIEWAGSKQIPLALIFTKIDKLKPRDLEKNIAGYKTKLLTIWEELPPIILTSAEKKVGREEISTFIEEALER